MNTFEMNTFYQQWYLELVPPHVGVEPIQCKWVFIIKYLSNGSIDRYKAHLVAKDFTQTYAIDYFETFSPVVQMDSVSIIYIIAVNQDWPIIQMDVKNAFFL